MVDELRTVEEIVDDEDDEEAYSLQERINRRYKKLQKKCKATIDSFIGSDRRVNSTVIMPRYYSALLAWALQRYIEIENWHVATVVGHLSPQPVYSDIETAPEQRMHVLSNGTMLVEREKDRFAITIDVGWCSNNTVIVSGMEQGRAEEFARGVEKIAKEQNFYRGKKLGFSGSIWFLKFKSGSWNDVILDPEIKQEIWDNTVGFLLRRDEMTECGIPAKRGVIMHGGPGTGKTLLCRSLVRESQDITCIVIRGSALEHEEFIYEAYELAQDLSPAIVFIEDIDFIAQDRIEYGCSKGPVFLTLLSVLDGIEEHKEIVTVATTNYVEVLDKAIGRRPARFDRTVSIPEPDLDLRKKLIKQRCQKIPLEPDIQEYIAKRTEKMTPAQIQEVIYSLVIACRRDTGNGDGRRFKFDTEAVDRAISWVNSKKQQHLGFNLGNNHNGDRHKIVEIQG